MNQRRLIIISVIIVAIVLAIILTVVLLWKRPATVVTTNTNSGSVTNTNTTVTTTTTDTTTDTNTDVSKISIERDDRQAITSAASSFTKRFGSYSTDTNFENIELSRYLMTETMSNQADRIIAAGQSSNTFSSVDSIVTGVTITDFTDGATGATVEVAARQTQRIGQGTTNYANAKARVTLKKIDGRWLIDSFRWL